MALIQCPNCGESISDKAKKCIHCGFEITPTEKYCVECGAALEKEMSVCPKCGCPVENENANMTVPQPVEVTGVKVAPKHKKQIMVIVFAVILIIVAVFGVRYIQKQNAEKEAEKIRQTYASNLDLAVTTMLTGAVDAENCGNLIKQVWYNSIYEEKDSKTDAYTRPKGYFVSDFNEALSNLFSDESFSSQISDIEDNQTAVQAYMRDLKNPPEEYKDAYEALSDFYDAYTKLTNLVVNPTGSLQTFSSNFNDADTETSNCYSALQLYID